MLYTETIDPSTLDLLKKLQSLEEFREVRLVGGTALALQIGHRKSVDLDFFGNMPCSLDELTYIISKIADVQPLSSSKMMRFLEINGIKVDIVNYPYCWIDEPVMEDGVILAGIKDIAAMKLSAITNRGSKKDFIDFFFLLQKFTLPDLIGLYEVKYPDAQIFATLKSLTYFDDAEEDPMPLMIKSLDWDSVKESIVSQVARYLVR